VWRITGKNAFSLSTFTAKADFTNTENITAGSGDDLFSFISTTVGKKTTSGSLTGQIDGGGNVDGDVLDYRSYTPALTVNLHTKTATGLGGFTNLESILGTTGKDTLVGPNQVNTWNLPQFSSGDINGLSFDGFENLTGGSLADTFHVSGEGAVSGVINGGGGSDTLATANLENTWIIQSKNAGQVDQSHDPNPFTSFKFSNIENL